MSWWRRYQESQHSHYPKSFNPHNYYHISRHYRGGTMFGRFFFFLVGMYAGVVANQRYRLPEAPTPCCGKKKTTTQSNSEEDAKSRLDDFPEIKEAIEKMKALEKRYRRSPPTDDQPGTPPSSSS
ncbi:hypothetical protein Btru_046082 [Bulinus truncatus]|nr:hypothetical protein Btru_046082 [Bulinus truncatus]